MANYEITSRSRTVAYQRAASDVGVSASWLRKFVNGYPEANEPSWSTGWRIVELYGRLCERIEADAAAKRARVDMLKGEEAAFLRRAQEIAHVPDGTTCDQLFRINTHYFL